MTALGIPSPVPGRRRLTAQWALLLLVVLVASGCLSRAGEPAPVADGWTVDTRRVRVVSPEQPDGIDAQIVVHRNSIGMDFVLIAAGEFMMGSPETECVRGGPEIPEKLRGIAGRSPAEGPQHGVRLTKAFLMGVTEVTQAQWTAVMGTTIAQLRGKGMSTQPDAGDLPMDFVSWHDANHFCQRLGATGNLRYRLPTEAEWEYACRAGSTTAFNTGTIIGADQCRSDHNWVYGSGRPDAVLSDRIKALRTGWGVYAPVGTYPANRWGLHDMHGNAYEWCADWYGSDYYRKSPLDDPQGPDEAQATLVAAIGGKGRVVRSFSAYNPPHQARSACRMVRTPGTRDNAHGAGFRVCLDWQR